VKKKDKSQREVTVKHFKKHSTKKRNIISRSSYLGASFGGGVAEVVRGLAPRHVGAGGVGLVVEVLGSGGGAASGVGRVHAVVANHGAHFPETRVAHAELVVAPAAALPVRAAHHVAWRTRRGRQQKRQRGRKTRKKWREREKR